MAAVDLRTVAELLGPKRIEMTMRYMHLAPQHKQGAVNKLSVFSALYPTVGNAQTARFC